MKPIWVCGHRKCGTTLLTNLLDGHPNLINYGSDFRMIYALYNGYDEYGNNDEIKDRFIKIFLDDRTDDDFINLSFINELIHKLDFSKKDFIWDYLALLNEKIASLEPKKRLFIKETSSEIYIETIMNLLDPQFIYVMRDPRDNWAAISAGVENYYSKIGERRLEALSSLINRIVIGFNAFIRFSSIYNQKTNKIITIKFEELTERVPSVMDDLSSQLEIDFEDILCFPTRNSKQYSGNSHDQIKFKGVSNQNVGKFLERVPREEIALVEALCGHIMDFFDYEEITSTSEQARALEKFYAFYNQRYFFYDKYQ